MLPNNQKFFRPYEPYPYGKEQIPEPKFKPYWSDSEEEEPSDTDSGSVTTTTSSPENLPEYSVFATKLQLNEAGGQNLPTNEAQLQYGLNKIRRDTSYAPYLKAFDIDLPFDSRQYDTSGNEIWKDTQAPTKQPVTSIIMLNSRDRDRSVYPTPANLTLRLPRTYKNVASLQVVQMKLLSSFLYFRPDKNNLCMTINEFGRINYNYLNQALGPLNVQKCIRPGTYNINSLLTEINTILNTPPLFYDYPNGFTDFVPLFVATGDFSIAFNYPGDYYYDSLNKQYIAAPSKAFIVSQYWATQTLGFTPNLIQTKVAYYYPVLREYVLDPDFGIEKLDTNINTTALLPEETIYSRIVYSFQGVNDQIIIEMINANATALDIYRSNHTFRQSLINKYVASYETFNNRINIQSPSLNTSLVNLLNAQYAIFLAQQLIANGLTAQTYQQLILANSQLLSVVNAMYDYIQRQLAIFFGINFNTFAPVYFTSTGNYVNIQNALNAIGVSSNYDVNVVSNPNPAITKNIIEQNRKEPIVNWPNMSNLTLNPQLGMLGYPTNLGSNNVAPYLGGSNFPYDLDVDNFDFTSPFIDAAGNIYTDFRNKSGDIITPIAAGRYTVFRFRSLYRQTLQVETMPRPTQYRYPAYNSATYGSNIITFFDNSYSFVFNSSNAKMDNVPFGSLSNIYGFSNPDFSVTTNFGINYTNSRALWGANQINFSVVNSLYNFVFYLPLPPSPPPGPAYRHNVAITITNIPDTSPIPSQMSLFIYQDRAAFMADLSGNARKENALHYKYVQTFGIEDASATLVFPVYAGQQYFGILRSTNISFQSLSLQVVIWYPDGPSGYTTLDPSISGFDPFADPTTTTALSNWNYAQVDDPVFIKLPVQSNLWGINPIGNEVNAGLAISNVPIGYDTNLLTGPVSTDLTDYVGYVFNGASNNILPNANVRTDPISGYFFQANSPYSPSAQSYFYSGASNFILTPATQANYTPSNVPYRQYKIVQWYDTTYIPDPVGFIGGLNPAVDVSPYISPYRVQSTSNVPISNYDYDVVTGNIQLGLGCTGFSFAPSDGVWSVDKIMFRSAVTAIDYNSNIAYLGIFITSQVNSLSVKTIALSNAVAKLDFNKRVTYSNAGSVNFGFDAALGTYYEFNNDPTYAQSPILGYSQNANVFYNQAQNFYSVIPFDVNSNIVYMRALTGALVPYPYVTDASAAINYFDGRRSPARQGIVVPYAAPPPNSPFGPPSGYTYTQSVYEQSLPIGTQILHYASQTILTQDLSGFIPWSGPGYSPTQMYADVSGVVMIQSTDFKFYSYPYNTQTRTFTYLYNLTVDTIYPPAELTTLVAAAGNSTTYAFLGFQVSGGAFQVRIKVFDVGLGTLTDLFVPVQFQIPDLGFSVNSFSITDNLGFVISGTSGLGAAVTYRTPSLAAPSFFIDTYPVGITSVKSVQPPTSDIIYFLPLTSTGDSPNYYYSINEVLDSTAPNARFTYTFTIRPTSPTSFNNIAVAAIPGAGNQILFTTNQDLGLNLVFAQDRFYLVRQVAGTIPNFTANIDYSDLIFTTPPPVSNPMAPLNILGGALGSKWAFFSQQPYIWGNRNDDIDAPVRVQNAWQMFYPTTKIVLRKLANSVNPIIDLSGLEYPEYPHTMMFAYNTKAGYIQDISNSVNPKWGFETSGGLLPANLYNLNSNGYLVSDPNFSGFYFNSYIFNVPLLPNGIAPNGTSNPEPYYYLAVRQYAPSEKSQVLVRFNLPQRYDFGFVRLIDLSNEPIFAPSNIGIFNPSYYTALLGFQSNFIFSNVNFGYNPQQNIPGSNLTSVGFGDFLRQYNTLYFKYLSNVAIINQIITTTNSNMLAFIGSNLQYVLPAYALTRENYTQSIQFSILWRSALSPTYLKLEDEWGLGWNLGFAKFDTPYGTIARATSFYKILDEYIYLRLNTEYDMNKLDFGAKENLKESTEPTGNILSYNAKLLLATFGSYAQTIIQNPVYFGPPVLKLDKLSFQWFDVAGVAIANDECEWNAAIQIVEEIPVPNIRGKNPVIIPR